MRWLGWALVWLATVGFAGACGGALAEGESEFKKGRYPEAKQTLASLETEAIQYDDADRAQYALYRGLTLGALGDRAQADVWLREAKALEAAHPGSLSPDDVHRLKVAIEGSGEPESRP